jgi:ATP-dependent DNA ligase
MVHVPYRSAGWNDFGCSWALHRGSGMGLEGIVSKRKNLMYRSGRSSDWLKMKNPAAPAVKREDEEDWGKSRGRWR